MSSSENNGASGANGSAPVVVKFGPAEDDSVSVAVAGKMLAALLDREDVLFTVLLAEAMTGIRLAKARHRAGPAELAEREAAGHG